MFNIFSNEVGRIIAYQEGNEAIIAPNVLNLENVINIKNKRIFEGKLVDMPENLIGENRAEALYHEAIKSKNGCFIEIGVYKGGSAWYLLQAAKILGRQLHLFDTFKGIPYQSEDDITPVGCFGDVNVDDVKNYLKGAHFHVGTFPATLPEDLGDISFIHFDGDQYQGVKDVKKYLWPKLVSGGKIFFDDSSYHGGMHGVNKAIDEDFPDYKIHPDVKMKYVVKV